MLDKPFPACQAVLVAARIKSRRKSGKRRLVYLTLPVRIDKKVRKEARRRARLAGVAVNRQKTIVALLEDHFARTEPLPEMVV